MTYKDKIPNMMISKIESNVLQRLIKHLKNRSDVQNIDLMNLAGFCRNCIARWYLEEAKIEGFDISKEESKKLIYGMSYEDWKNKYQKE